MPRAIRRVVTGHNAAGRSVFINDAAAPHVYNRGPGSAVVTEVWETRATPASNSGSDEVTDHPFRLAPPKNGSVFRIIEYPPDKQRLAALEQQRASADDSSGHGAAFDRGSPRHPGFHKTNSVDYAIVLAGEIHALMDEGEVLLKAGDVLVQRGTNHAWSNRTDEPAYLAFVLIDAEPV
jgi:mannose-6-phosphate isomerase-like protein (cupin superfamily)